MAFESTDIQFNSESGPQSIDFDALKDAGIEIEHDENPSDLDQDTIDSVANYLNADEEEEKAEHDPEIASLIENIKTQKVIEEKANQRSLIEHIMAKLGYQYDGTESNLMAELDENSNFVEVPHQDVKTIETKHTYGGAKEVKLVHLAPLEQADLENEGLDDVGIDTNKEMYLVFVKDVEGAEADSDAELGYSEDQSMKIPSFEDGDTIPLKNAA